MGLSSSITITARGIMWNFYSVGFLLIAREFWVLEKLVLTNIFALRFIVNIYRSSESDYRTTRF